MTNIAIPTRIFRTCEQLNDPNTHYAALNRFAKTSAFSKAVIQHKQQFQATSTQEYTTALNILLSHYDAGKPVNLNAMINQVSTTLDDQLNTEETAYERTLSRNTLRDSFVDLLKNLSLIEGEKPLLWAYLDTRPLPKKWRDDCVKYYQQFIKKTAAQRLLEQAQCEQKYLKKAHVLTDENRIIQTDIKTQLEYLKKQEAKCKAIANELNVPYSEIKAKMEKQQSPLNTDKIKAFLFFGLVGVVFAIGLLTSSSDEKVQDQNQPPVLAENLPAYPGLSDSETSWRDRYIQLFKQYGTISQAMETEMLELSGEYMIPKRRMDAIIKTIKKSEVQ